MFSRSEPKQVSFDHYNLIDQNDNTQIHYVTSDLVNGKSKVLADLRAAYDTINDDSHEANVKAGKFNRVTR